MGGGCQALHVGPQCHLLPITAEERKGISPGHGMPPPPPPPMLFALLPLCIPWSSDAGHPLTPSDGPHRPLKCPWHPRMKVGHAWGEAWPGQSLEACGRVFRGNRKGLVSQEE